MNLYKNIFNARPKFVIYGMGTYGKEWASYLVSIGISIDFFCDGDKSKQGTNWRNITCISLDDLIKIKDESTIMVAILDFEPVIDILEKSGIDPGHIHSQEGLGLYPMGHYYSLYPNIDEILQQEEKIFSHDKQLLNINLNDKVQIEFLKLMQNMYSSVPKWSGITDPAVSQFRYRLGNDYFPMGDAVALHCMLRIFEPRNIIEVGSGYSSAVTLDTNQFYLDNKMNLTFIEPFPARLKSLLKESDTIQLIEAGLQDVPLDTFDKLEENDILFIDSTHVSKINSDVNYLFFEIFPRLKKGVIIHLHDIFYPFEYPKEWIKNGMIWNEIYLLRAFLQNNAAYEIMFYQHMMQEKYTKEFENNWGFEEKLNGGSFWLRKK